MQRGLVGSEMCIRDRYMDPYQLKEMPVPRSSEWKLKPHVVNKEKGESVMKETLHTAKDIISQNDSRIVELESIYCELLRQDATIQGQYTEFTNELSVDEKNLKDALEQLQSRYQEMESQRKEKENRMKSYRELIGHYKKLTIIYQQKMEKIEKVYIKGEELLKALDILYLNLTQNEQKTEEEKQLEEGRANHLEGLKTLREEYRKFERGIKKVIKDKKKMGKDQESHPDAI
eukprot:TRINITY_DN5847_c0_g1_i1.p1 TRINITY_DN5847_c0_g1~~TRINITY_DN5847_c0_g1_i1.p1  ORF type:complete len:232 (-),score=69.19 TRINITY_DN5847_c0_g1_i1:29-724(-)